MQKYCGNRFAGHKQKLIHKAKNKAVVTHFNSIFAALPSASANMVKFCRQKRNL